MTEDLDAAESGVVVGADGSDHGIAALRWAADAAVAFVVTDEDSDEPKGARLIVMGMSINWLPESVAEVLVRNYADWMFEDK